MNIKNIITIFENKKEQKIDSLVLKWGLVCWAGSQVSFLGLKIKKIILSHLGSIFLILSLLLFLIYFGPVLFFETRYKITTLKQNKQNSVSYFGQLAKKQVDISLEKVPNADFSIIIPKIGAKSAVIANVDPSNEEEYKSALKSGVAHAKGTYFPGMDGNITLFAHSTDTTANISRYNAVFYLLRELEKNDRIFIYFKGIKYTYTVSAKQIVEPSDISWFKKQYTQEKLILHTCWPPGTSMQRILIIADRIKT